MMNWLRENRYAAVLLTFIRLYLGFNWMIHGWEKLTAATPFNAAGFMKNAVANPVVDKTTKELIYPTYTAFVETFALPNAKLFNFLIPLGEFLVGLGLILGALTTAAMFFGLLMNFMFMFAGTISTNPWMVLVGFVILAAGANAGKFGLDYYILPYTKKMIRAAFHKNDPGTKGKPIGGNPLNRAAH
ncbi:DoxX family protein [Paenibacillus puerhi]|uniref:DoxX family protein n=1 Tax=Paenibacillus puerhi TaxID=2692622 RepID=UPI0019157368|nr:DoxX family protein [Paenibacillus puerhi]